jgi:hypothetical protein
MEPHRSSDRRSIPDSGSGQPRLFEIRDYQQHLRLLVAFRYRSAVTATEALTRSQSENWHATHRSGLSET